MINFSSSRLFFACLLGLTASLPLAAHATGMLPDTPLLVISEADGSSQKGLRNTDNEPLLLHTTIIDLPEDKGPGVFALPPVTRVEANGRQVVRFILEKSETPLTVQHLKRVRFEGIPPELKDEAGRAVVRLTVAQVLPIVISPKGLEQDKEPWKKLTFRQQGDSILISNPSPFVARLSQEVSLLPSGKQVKRKRSIAHAPCAQMTVGVREHWAVCCWSGARRG